MPARTQAKPRAKATEQATPANAASKFTSKFKDNVDDPTKKKNEDLKKLIENLKTKIGTNKPSAGAAPGLANKKRPPAPKAKGTWNRSVKKEWNATPAYNVLTRISNHEKVPTRNTKTPNQTVKNLPHSFLYKPGADGITVDKVNVKAGKQVTWG